MSLRDQLADRALLAVLAVGTALRLFALGEESLWMDEIYSVTDALRWTTRELLTVLPVVKNHVPLYYVLLRGWTDLGGVTEAWLRLPSAVAGVGTILAAFLVVEHLFDRRVALLTAALVALSPFQVQHAQEVRMYGFVALLATVSFYWLARLSTTYSRRTVAGYLLATVLLTYTHPYGLFVLLAGNVYVALRLLAAADVAHTLRRWVAVQAGVGLLLSPWLALMVRKTLSVTQDRAEPLAWRTPPDAVQLLGTVSSYFGYPAHPLSVLVVVPLVGGVAALSVVRLDRSALDSVGSAARSLRAAVTVDVRNPDATTLLLCWALVPIVVPALVSHLLTPVYGVRYTIGASVAWYALVAVGVSRLRRPHLRYVVAAVLVVGTAAPLAVYYGDTQNEQWREATTHVADRAAEGDLVLFTDRDGEKPWGFYADRPNVTVREVPTDADWRNVSDSLGRYETVWVLNRTYPSTNENRPAAAVLADTHRRAETWSFVGIDVYRFERRANVTARNAG